MDNFAYLPLNPGATKAARIIRLYPSAAFGAAICCELIVIGLGEAYLPVYEAISYTWDGQSPSEDHFLMCHDENGHYKKLLVTRNCEAVLRHVRLEKEVRFIWIDSVCIDQSSNQERSHQVGIMGDIYARAEKVLVWLGEDSNPNVRRTFECIREIAQNDPNDVEDRDRLTQRIDEILGGEKSAS
jgi:hypothetical protein